MARIRSVTTMAELSASMMAAFNAINEHYYNGELEKPVITFKEGKRKSAYGWIETRKQWIADCACFNFAGFSTICAILSS